MTRKARVKAAVSHTETDIVPYNIDFTKQEYDKVAHYLDDKDFRKKLGNHISSAYYDGYLEEMSPGSGYFKDDFGVVWNRNGADKDIGVIDGFIITVPSLAAYSFPQLDEERIRRDYDMLMAADDDKFKFGSIGFSMFERAWTLRGMENLLTDMVLEPDFAHALLDRIAEYNMQVMDIAMEYDIDGFHFGDDWGQQKGLIMGPDYWKKFIKPRMKMMFDKAKAKGLILSLHSCGDIHEIFPDLIDIGLDIYQTFQPEIYNLKETKKQFGADLTFWGGISTQRLLPFASPALIKETVKETMDIMAKGGGYIAAPTHSIPGDVPAENVVALIDALKSQ
jgi:uroporphyrinogen decarboxylase